MVIIIFRISLETEKAAASATALSSFFPYQEGVFSVLLEVDHVTGLPLNGVWSLCRIYHHMPLSAILLIYTTFHKSCDPGRVISVFVCCRSR